MAISCLVVWVYGNYNSLLDVGGAMGRKICLSCFVGRRYTVYAYFVVAV